MGVVESGEIVKYNLGIKLYAGFPVVGAVGELVGKCTEVVADGSGGKCVFFVKFCVSFGVV